MPTGMPLPAPPSPTPSSLPIRLMISLETVPDTNVKGSLGAVLGSTSLLLSSVEGSALGSSLVGVAPASLRRGSFPGGSHAFLQMRLGLASPPGDHYPVLQN